MSSTLIELNADLRKLREDGYNVCVQSSHLVVRDVPYVNPARQVRCDGILITNLELSGDKTNAPQDHRMYFLGETPSTCEGVELAAIRPLAEETKISKDLIAQFTCSTKPLAGYPDYYAKVKAYVGAVWAYAAAIDNTVTPLTRRVVVPEEEDSPFNYLDTMSARAEVNVITQKLAADKIAVVGLGGTGSYILDFVAKTPVREIHLFDGDTLSSHNAFRSPGAPSIEQLRLQPYKVDHLKSIYEKMHRRITAHPEFIDNDNVEKLKDMTFVFLSIDGGPRKEAIVRKLEEFGTEFVDTGIGLFQKNDSLGGLVRLTTSLPNNRDEARKTISFHGDDGLNEYEKNIQIADLNAFNAILAIFRWKKLRTFYMDRKKETFTQFNIGGNFLHNDTDED